MPGGKIPRKLIGVVVLFLVLGASLAVLPRVAGEHGLAIGNACLNRAELGEGDRTPSECLAAAERWLWVPLHLPVHASAHDDEASELRARANRLELFDATQRVPSVARRDAAARSIAAERGARAVPLLADFGAHAELVRATRGGDFAGSDDDLDDAIDAAILVADLDSARRLASSKRSGGAWQRRGALACLLGDRAAGLRLLTEQRAPETSTRYVSATWVGSAILACGGSIERKRDSWIATPALLSSYGPSTLAVKLEPLAAKPRDARDLALLPFAIERATAEDELIAIAARFFNLPLAEVLRALAIDVHCIMRRCAIAEPQSPWSLLELNDDPLGFVPLARLEAAADRLEKAAATLPEKLPQNRKPPKDVACNQCSSDDVARLRQAWIEPRAAVLRAASDLRFVAAVEWARRGRAAEAKRAAARGERLARPLREDEIAIRASAHLLARDAPAALAAVEAGVFKYPGYETIPRALALASLGRYAEAYAQANHYGSSDAIWLASALALISHRPKPDFLGRLEHADPRTPPPQQWLDSPAWWWRLAQLPEAERRAARAAILREADPERARERLAHYALDYAQALPAVLFLIGYVARDADVEVWLDRVIGAPRARARKLMLARAEAARWRGDDRAAALWESRAARLAALIADDRSAVLATFAGF